MRSHYMPNVNNEEENKFVQLDKTLRHRITIIIKANCNEKVVENDAYPMTPQCYVYREKFNWS